MSRLKEWISDKARFSYDGLRLQRIESPYIRKNGQLVPAHWAEAFDIIAQQLYKSLSNTSTKPRILGLVSESIDLESAWVLKRWFQLLGANFDLKTALDNEIKCNLQVNYLQNTSIASIEESDLCLLIGVDPRYEASLLNVRLRKRYLEGGFTVASVGSPLNLTFPCQQLGLGKKTFIDVCEGYHPFSKQLAMAQKPIVIIGSTLFSSKTDNSLAYNLVNVLKSNVPALVNSDWNGLNFLNLEVNSVGIFDLGISEENSNNQYDIAFLLASDLSSTKLSKDTFVIYQGSHGDISANIADVVLPGATFVEKSNIFTNVEGHSQIANKVISPPGLAREDWKVLTELIRFLIRTCLVNKKVVSKGRQKLSNTDKIIKLVPSIASCYNTNYYYRNESHTFLETKLGQTKFNNSEKLPFNKSVHNFYITSNITRASVTMVKCSSIYNNKDNFI